MGDILAAVKVASAAKQAYDAARGPDPGVGPQAQAQIPQAAPVPDVSTQGMSQAGGAPAPLLPGLSISDLSGQGATSASLPDNSPPIAADPTSMLTSPGFNPYAGDTTNYSPTAIASSLGSTSGSSDSSSAPIVVQGKDSFQPQKESTLGKIGDVLLMLRGQNPIFRERTIQANERAAIQSAMQDGQLNTALAEKRMESIPGANPMDALNMAETQGRASYFQSVGDQRADMQRDKGVSMFANAFGPGGALNPSNPNAAQNYTNMRPLLQKMGGTFGIPQDMLGTMLPDQYDPTLAQTIAATGMSGYDQLRAGIMQSNSESEIAARNQAAADRQVELNLRAQGLKIQQANSMTEAAKAVSDIQKNSEGSFSNRQSFYQKVLGPAARVPWLYGNFMGGKFGSGSAGIPRPGVAYVSPDKTMAMKMNANGSWSVYDVSKGTNHARLVQTLGGVVSNGTQDNGDFAQ